MDRILDLHDRAFAAVEAHAGALVPLLARGVFAATLLVYFWRSAATKLGDGVFGFLSPSTGAYAQIFPKAFEAVGYDASQLTVFHWAVAVAGTWAEFLLPLLIVLGLFTRLSALGMIGFIAVQSLTDLYGHGGIAHAETLGAWFDAAPDGVILDQRAFWVFTLSVLMIRGAGALSLDAALHRQLRGAPEAAR
ncbi:DoxX family membrane protein [Thalassococcus profundi]|uniref:DoxX family membrane protein n=1 Tax=Thalassococcus profundi TaxID=2282382 RepID=A0A369TK56_9RHOB|nr:DoxX family membrane protein [Thalassococcus profundi]RDD64517.1 DoxX family membrane protein [Thalassococcus profundi]